MMDKYTKISAEIQYYDGEKTKFELYRNAWDLDGEQMGELFRQLMLAMGFSPNTVASVFGDDEEVYQETADLACCDPDEARLEPCCGETLSKVFADLDKSGKTLVIGSTTDPCFYCDQICKDTACLHEDDAGPTTPREWHDGDGDVE
jgi:hypothetical protein